MWVQNIWRTIALVLCAAVPAGFYVIGDLADAFPGVLTMEQAEDGPAAGPRADAESFPRQDPEVVVPGAAPSIAPGTASDLQSRLDELAQLPVVEGNLAYTVVDTATGEILAERDGGTARVPASTMKLLTAAALLRVSSGDEVLLTRVQLSGDTLTLIGGGDMFLTEEKLADLADQTVLLLQGEGAGAVSLVLDDTYLDGGTNPEWGANGPEGGWVAPTASIAVDSGKLDAEQYGRKSLDPSGDAASRFAELLRDRGVEVTGEVTRGTAAAEGSEVRIESAPLREIIQRILLTSDNTGAELLAHLVAREHGEGTAPADASAAVEAEIRDLAADLGVPDTDLEALDVRDGSGLSVGNRVPPRLLAVVLGEVASGGAPDLEPLLFGVPVGGLSGTLAERFAAPGTSAARGVVRGKTGYLGGTASLAGVATLPDGRTVSFDIVVHGFDGSRSKEARAAVDEVAAEIVREP